MERRFRRKAEAERSGFRPDDGMTKGHCELRGAALCRSKFVVIPRHLNSIRCNFK